MLTFSLAGSSNPLDDLIGDILDSTDSSNLLAGIEVNSTTPHQSQQTQQLPMIIPPTPLHSLRPTAGEMVSPGMVPHGVTHPRATMLPTHPIRPTMPPTGYHAPHGPHTSHAPHMSHAPHGPHTPHTSCAFHWMGLSQVWWRGRAIWDDARTVCKPDSNGQTWWDGDEHGAACFTTHDPKLQPSHGGRCPTI